jgi:hypothetical protein
MHYYWLISVSLEWSWQLGIIQRDDSFYYNVGYDVWNVSSTGSYPKTFKLYTNKTLYCKEITNTDKTEVHG